MEKKDVSRMEPNINGRLDQADVSRIVDTEKRLVVEPAAVQVHSMAAGNYR